MAVRSKRLAGPQALAAGSNLLYTCPSGETALVKMVTYANAGAVGRAVNLYIGSAILAHLVDQQTLAVGQIVQRTTWLVLVEGEELRAAPSAATDVVVSVHGAELEGLAD